MDRGYALRDDTEGGLQKENELAGRLLPSFCDALDHVLSFHTHDLLLQVLEHLVDHPWLDGEAKKARKRTLRIMKARPGIGLLYVAVWSLNLESVLSCVIFSHLGFVHGHAFFFFLAFKLEDCEFRDATGYLLPLFQVEFGQYLKCRHSRDLRDVPITTFSGHEDWIWKI